MNSDMKTIAAMLAQAETILIFAHKNPDGDAVGSAICAGLLLKKLGKTVHYCMKKDQKGCAALLEESKYFEQPLSDSYDAALVVDSSTQTYIWGAENLTRCARILLIDHHMTNEGFGDYSAIDPKAGATGELIYLLSESLGVPLDCEMAHAIYIALVEDTGNFTYSNTTARTHRIAANLYDVCSDFYLYADKLKKYEKKRLDLMRVVLDHVEFYCGSRLIIGKLLYSDPIDYLHADTDGLIDMIRNVSECKLAVFIKQVTENGYKVSMRSGEDAINVSDISKQFGGGGHKKAAGFEFHGELSELTGYFRQLAEMVWTDFC
ncbi:MAG: bifunctional oligoribonuclease/PAP phosphatase NrnA [Anaerofustis sp.]